MHAHSNRVGGLVEVVKLEIRGRERLDLLHVYKPLQLPEGRLSCSTSQASEPYKQTNGVLCTQEYMKFDIHPL